MWRKQRKFTIWGIPAVILFGIPEDKDIEATGAWHDCGIVQKAATAIKKAVPELLVIADTCLCEYTTPRTLWLFRNRGSNRESVKRSNFGIAQRKLRYLKPKQGQILLRLRGMMDGFVKAIREGLDDAGFEDIPILSYAAKYASAYYGPFRDAADSAPSFGDRRTYQMNPANGTEALKEIELDIAEGADMLMVKPALSYMDIIWRVKEATNLPVAAYNVSGEYSMVKAAALNGWIDEKKVTLETLTSFKRAGADLILTYHAKDAVRWLGES